MPHASRHSTRVSPADVRELVSRPMRRTSRERHAGEQRDRRDVAVRDDPEVRHDPVRLRPAQVLDRRDHPEIDRRRRAAARRTGRHVEPQLEEIRRAGPDRGRADARSGSSRRRAEPCRARSASDCTLADAAVTSAIIACSNEPSRSTGSSPAAVMLPRISSIGLRRRPRSPSSADTRVHVVGAHGERDLRELRAVERPVDLDGVDVVGEQPRHRDLLHVVVPGRRLGDGADARQRRERAHAADGRLDVARQRDEVGARRRPPAGGPSAAGPARRRRARRESRPRRPAADRPAPRRRSRRPAAASRATRSRQARGRAAGELEQIGQRIGASPASRRRARARALTAATAAVHRRAAVPVDADLAGAAPVGRQRLPSGIAIEAWTSNTRTNVVRRAVAAAALVVALARRRRSGCGRRGSPALRRADIARHGLPSLADARPRSPRRRVAACCRGADARRPRAA